MAAASRPKELYHEKQVSLYCGVHALNTLLQGPHYSTADLTGIAREFDEAEKRLMRESGVESQDYLRYMVRPDLHVGSSAPAEGLATLPRGRREWRRGSGGIGTMPLRERRWRSPASTLRRSSRLGTGGFFLRSLNIFDADADVTCHECE
jgi:hypothetical protein